MPSAEGLRHSREVDDWERASARAPVGPGFSVSLMQNAVNIDTVRRGRENASYTVTAVRLD